MSRKFFFFAFFSPPIKRAADFASLNVPVAC